MDETLADAVLRDALLLQRVAANDQAQAEDVLKRLSAELRTLVASLDGTGQRAVNSMIREAEQVIANGYGDLGTVVDTQELAQIIADHTTTAIGQTLGVEARPVTPERLASLTSDVLIEGAPTSAWWAKQSEDMAFRFAQQVRQGVIAGETQERIVARVAGAGGVLDVSRRYARTLVHSSVMSAANVARLATFRKNSRFIAGVRFLATLDSHTCARCGAHDGQAWDLDGNPLPGTKLPFEAPPLHASCRCVLTPVPKRTLISDDVAAQSMRASSEGPIKGSTTFEQFLKRQSSAFVESALGKGRADLFLSGKLSLADLLSGTGRPLTLAELRAR